MRVLFRFFLVSMMAMELAAGCANTKSAGPNDATPGVVDGAVTLDAPTADSGPLDGSWADSSLVDGSPADASAPDALVSDAVPASDAEVCVENLVSLPAGGVCGSAGPCLNCFDDPGCLACIQSNQPNTPNECFSCYVQAQAACFNPLGCQAEWDCFNQCVTVKCAGDFSDIACRMNDCADTDSAYFTCKEQFPLSDCWLMWTFDCS